MSGTISSLGIGTSIDLQGTLDQLRKVDEQVITEKENKVSGLETQLEEFTTVQSKLLDMKEYARSLSLESTFLDRQATSSSEGVLTLSSTDGAQIKSTVVTVESLASKSSWNSTGSTSKSSVVYNADSDQSTTFAYQIGDTTVTLEVAGGTTLSELVEQINDDANNPGVTASLINNGAPDNPYQLILQADETGEDNRISIVSQLADLTLTEKTGANDASLNAAFSVDGVDYQRQSNTVSDVISSVSFTLQSTGTSTITITNDTDSLKEMITNLVTAYNDAVSEIDANDNYDSDSEEFGSLANTGFSDLKYTMQNLMNSIVKVSADSSVTSLFDLGIEYNSDGTISLDTDTLTDVLENNYDAIKDFFVGNEDEETDGFAEKLNDFLRVATTEDAGVYASETSLAQQRIDDLEAQIEKQTERLDKKYEILTKQYNELDKYLSQMTEMSDYLTETFNSITGTSSD